MGSLRACIWAAICSRMRAGELCQGSAVTTISPSSICHRARARTEPRPVR
jgi:hypothetical protein